MAAGDLITDDWQAEFNGLLIGEGSPFSIVQVDGLLSHPEVVASDQGRLRRHGLRPGDDWLAGRSVVLTVEVYASTPLALAEAVDGLKLAFRPGRLAAEEAPLVFQLPGVAGGAKGQVNARARRAAWPVDRDFYYGRSVVPIERHATDPRLYAAGPASVASTTLPTQEGGLTFNAVAPLTFGDTSTGGTLVALNVGTYDAPVSFRVTGPVQTPRIIDAATGRELKLNTTLEDGEYVVIDSASRSVLLGGTADRYQWLSSDSQWFDIAPGPTSIDFRGASSGSGTLSASWRSAWI